MKIDLGNEVEIEVSYKGKAYKLREPTVDEVDKLDANEDGVKIDIIEFLTRLGMPQDVVRGMGVSKAKALLDGMISLISKKN